MQSQDITTQSQDMTQTIDLSKGLTENISKELLKNFSYIGKRVLLQNEYINIVLSNFDKWNLEGFYNENKNNKNAARCGLYLLLEKLLTDRKLEPETNIFVDNVNPSSRIPGAYNKLIETYKSIGFTIDSGTIDKKNVILISTVSTLMSGRAD
jgi:hypothetical protein